MMPTETWAVLAFAVTKNIAISNETLMRFFIGASPDLFPSYVQRSRGHQAKRIVIAERNSCSQEQVTAQAI